MSSKAPIVIDADAFDPVPPHVFRMGGRDYSAFALLQLSNAQREKVVRFDDHLKACQSVAEQVALCVEVIAAFVPGVPVDLLRETSIEKLIHCVSGLVLAGSDETAGEERPTKGQRKSGSRRTTRR